MSTGSGSGISDAPSDSHGWWVSAAEFDRLVESALDSIPDEIGSLIRNVVVLVEDQAPADDPTLLGRYDGVALTERAANHAGFLPDQILLFREPLMAMCDSAEELAHEIALTVVHEVAHHFGLDEQRIHDLGFG